MSLIIFDRNKQYLINKNIPFKVDFLDVNVGDIIEIKNILFFDENNEKIIGKPFVENKSVLLKVIKQEKEKKKTILKFKRRKHYIKKMGHRQKYTLLQAFEIKAN